MGFFALNYLEGSPLCVSFSCFFCEDKCDGENSNLSNIIFWKECNKRKITFILLWEEGGQDEELSSFAEGSQSS